MGGTEVKKKTPKLHLSRFLLRKRGDTYGEFGQSGDLRETNNTEGLWAMPPVLTMNSYLTSYF